MPHLPDAHQNKDDGLAQGPPKDSGIGTVTDLPKTLFSLLGGREGQIEEKRGGKTAYRR